MRFLAGLFLGAAAVTGVNLVNPFFPIMLFCGEGPIGILFHANRCF